MRQRLAEVPGLPECSSGFILQAPVAEMLTNFSILASECVCLDTSKRVSLSLKHLIEQTLEW